MKALKIIRGIPANSTEESTYVANLRNEANTLVLSLRDFCTFNGVYNKDLAENEEYVKICEQSMLGQLRAIIAYSGVDTAIVLHSHFKSLDLTQVVININYWITQDRISMVTLSKNMRPNSESTATILARHPFLRKN